MLHHEVLRMIGQKEKSTSKWSINHVFRVKIWQFFRRIQIITAKSKSQQGFKPSKTSAVRKLQIV